MGTAQHFTPEEIALANWLGDDEAKSILRSCALNAPRFEHHAEVYPLTRDDFYTPIGHRADRLKAIWTRHSDAVHAHCDATGDYDLSAAFHLLPRPNEAIEQVLAAAPLIKTIAVIAKHRDPVAAGRQARAA
jgi:hypothetical protein